MYTQCPQCDTAFRVTAPDLQRASGRVLCAGCGREFNALERLSEESPAVAGQAGDADSLLDTLNELTGPREIRIEDTGVEWRVIDDDDASEDVADDDFGYAGGNDESDEDLERLDAPAEELDSPPTSRVRWYLDEPVEEPNAAADAAGQDAVSEGADDAVDESLDDDEQSFAHFDFDVQRYDDNTPLPDDFVEEEEPEIFRRRAEDQAEPRAPEADEAQVDLGLGEPADWMDLLDEVAQRNEAPASGEQGQPQAVAPGAPENLSAVDQELHTETPAPSSPEAGDDALADTDIHTLDEEGDAPPDDGYPADIDTQFDLQAIEMGIDLTGSRNLALQKEPGQDESPTADAYDEKESADTSLEDLNREHSEEELATDGLPEQGDAEVAAAARHGADAGGDTNGGDHWLELSDEPGPLDEDSDEAETRRREGAFEEEFAAAWATWADDIKPDEATADAARPDDVAQADAIPNQESMQPADDPVEAQHHVPPQTEEEMTINMLIDQDLIRLAEQQDVFTTTQTHSRLEDAPNVETIIMEGDFVRNALEADLASRNECNAHEGHVHSGAGVHGSGTNDNRAPESPADDDDILGTFGAYHLRGGRRRNDPPPSYRVIGGVAALALVLAAQVVHAYRDSLATYPVFDRTVGSVYRLLGEPLNPNWNIKEWQFESTSGRTGETDEILTISSRVANSSSKALPYPLLHISLTDRWEEIVGSKVLEPGDYLHGDTDPSARVPPGASFTALVRVEAPSPEATGFKLNVCYRETGTRVRCATEDFKD